VLCNSFADTVDSNIIHDYSGDDPRVRDYLDIGINSPRGIAIESILDYARWIANHVQVPEGKNTIIPDGFDSMPEVRSVIEEQLKQDNRHVGVMSVIGVNISLLYWIDKQWLAEKSNMLFDLEGIDATPSRREGWAAWNSFLVWNRPHIEFYRLFKQQYAFAVNESAKVSISDDGHEKPMIRLGEHLFHLYGNGKLELKDDNGILEKFVMNSASEIRRRAIGSIGLSLKVDYPIPPIVLSRFMDLWKIYWEGPGRKDMEEKPEALTFGSWFSSGKFDPAWALEEMDKFTDVSPKPAVDYHIKKELEKNYSANITKSISIIGKMIRNDKEGWRVYEWGKTIRPILEMAMKAGGDARAQAEQLIDHLGRRGYSDLGELLRIEVQEKMPQ
jgi:hypothetical protein